MLNDCYGARLTKNYTTLYSIVQLCTRSIVVQAYHVAFISLIKCDCQQDGVLTLIQLTYLTNMDHCQRILLTKLFFFSRYLIMSSKEHFVIMIIICANLINLESYTSVSYNLQLLSKIQSTLLL